MVTNHLNCHIAWEIFSVADRFQLDELRDVSMTAILKEPKLSLAKRPEVSETLLQEVLGSDLLCISDEDLIDLLVKWEDATEGGCLTRAELIQKYVSMQSISEGKLRGLKHSFGDEEEFERIKKLKTVCVRSEHTRNVLHLIQNRFDLWANKALSNAKPSNYDAYFLANWVHLVHNPDVTFSSALPLIASGRANERIRLGSWLEWNLPRFAVKLLSIRLHPGVTIKGTSVRFLCKGENCVWQEVHFAKDLPEILEERVIQCRSENLVKGFRVEIVSGQLNLNYFAFEGLLQERD